MQFRLEKRQEPSKLLQVLAPVGAVLLTVVLGAIIFSLLGYDGDEPQAEGFYLPLEGMPRRSELLAHYEAISGLSTENIDYYLVLANFKIGIVLEKTYAAGVTSGKGDSEVVAAFGPMILQSIAKAAELAQSLPAKTH